MLCQLSYRGTVLGARKCSRAPEGRQARAGARASAYERLRAMARWSCCFVMFERPSIFRRFAWL
jgi:hypothetical protein